MDNPGIKWSDWTRSMERFLRLKTFPVGLKMLEDSSRSQRQPVASQTSGKALSVSIDHHCPDLRLDRGWHGG